MIVGAFVEKGECGGVIFAAGELERAENVGAKECALVCKGCDLALTCCALRGLVATHAAALLVLPELLVVGSWFELAEAL